MNIEKEREAFEAWLFQTEKFKNRNKSFLFMLDENGNYEDIPVFEHWQTWQAAKAQAVPEGFVLVPVEPTDIEIESIKEKHWSMRGCQLCKSDYIDLYKAMLEAQEQDQ